MHANFALTQLSLKGHKQLDLHTLNVQKYWTTYTLYRQEPHNHENPHYEAPGADVNPGWHLWLQVFSQQIVGDSKPLAFGDTALLLYMICQTVDGLLWFLNLL